MKINNISLKKKGMTLIELIVSITIFSVVMIFIMGMITPLLKSYGESAALQQCRTLVDNTVDDIARQLQYADDVKVGTGLVSASTIKSVELVADGSLHAIKYDGTVHLDADHLMGYDITELKFEQLDDDAGNPTKGLRITLTLTDPSSGITQTGVSTVSFPNVSSDANIDIADPDSTKVEFTEPSTVKLY